MDYIIKCSKINYGITYNSIRQLAYKNGRRLQCKFHSGWIGNKTAGTDLILGSIKRHKNLILRKPENTILFWENAFNTNVKEYFDNYQREFKYWKLTADTVYNIGETGGSTVVVS